MRKNIFMPLALGMAIISGCARDVSISSNELTKEYLEMWVKENYPEAKLAGSGIYILEEKEGSGDLYNFESYAMLGTTISSMSGDISSTTDEQF